MIVIKADNIDSVKNMIGASVRDLIVKGQRWSVFWKRFLDTCLVFCSCATGEMTAHNVPPSNKRTHLLTATTSWKLNCGKQ